jgi:chemotaxis methyl-accepting protein methylase
VACGRIFDFDRSFCHADPVDPTDFRRLLDHLNLSWSGYRKVRRGVERRVARHMQQIGCRGMPDYLERLGREPAIRIECERRMTVPISRFFRDRRLWEVLEARVLPQLLDREPATFRVWSAGCSRGEEVYSFTILWERLRAAGRKMPALAILATDLDPGHLAAARRGVFGRSSLKEVSAEDRSRWFEPVSGGDRLAVPTALRTGVAWQVHDLRDPPPEGGFQLVFLRNNALTYYREDARLDILSMLMPALAPAGFLVIGARERLPDAALGLAPLPECRYILTRCFPWTPSTPLTTPRSSK